MKNTLTWEIKQLNPVLYIKQFYYPFKPHLATEILLNLLQAFVLILFTDGFIIFNITLAREIPFFILKRHRTLLFCKTFCSAALIPLATSTCFSGAIFTLVAFSAFLPWGRHVKLHVDRIDA